MADTTTNKPLPLNTGAGMVAWVEANVPQDKREGQTPLEAACWWCAASTAVSLAEYSTRELATICAEGLPGIKTVEDVDEFLEAYREEEYEGNGEAALLEDWQRFWELTGVSNG